MSSTYIIFMAAILFVLIVIVLRKNRSSREEKEMSEPIHLVNKQLFKSNSGPFEMKVEDIFIIADRGIVVTGQISRGSVNVGDKVFLKNAMGNKKQVNVVGLELYRKVVSEANTGEHVGILLKDIEKAEIKQGDILMS